VPRGRALRAPVFSTEVTNDECATCSGPTHRLQQLPQALSRPSQVPCYYILFAAEGLSPSTRERVQIGSLFKKGVSKRQIANGQAIEENSSERPCAPRHKRAGNPAA